MDKMTTTVGGNEMEKEGKRDTVLKTEIDGKGSDGESRHDFGPLLFGLRRRT